MRWFVCLSVLAALLSLGACKPKPDADPSIGVSITGINYTAEGVQSYYVDGTWAGNLPTYGGGGGTICCVLLPQKWVPGMSMTVDWTIGHYTKPYSFRKHLSFEEEGKCCWIERTLKQTVQVQKYDRPAQVQVFFLPDDKLEIWVYDSIPLNPHHPSGRPYPKDPRPYDPEEN